MFNTTTIHMGPIAAACIFKEDFLLLYIQCEKKEGKAGRATISSIRTSTLKIVNLNPFIALIEDTG